MVRLSSFGSGRHVLDPRHNVLRPSNSEHKAMAEMGP
jgi:hypothetical protein